VFFDHMGPAVFRSGAGVDVRPHPHIGLATLTYVFDGEIMHRDSLGTAIAIRPGEVNLMTAGRGIVHSERTAPERKARGGNLHGLQCWLGLPAAQEETDPAFAHYGVDEFPAVRDNDKSVRVVLGSLYGARSPVVTASDTVFADATLQAGAVLPVDAHYEERSVYVIDGEIEISGDRFSAGQLLVLRPGDHVTVKAATDARTGAHVMIVGGAAMDGPRHLWWNFVSSRKERIEQAKAEWAAGHFAKVPGDEIEFIPLPEK
jgi:redox-sensitive bicupin YhaK (pirin superfamily)